MMMLISQGWWCHGVRGIDGDGDDDENDDKNEDNIDDSANADNNMTVYHKQAECWYQLRLGRDVGRL